MRFIHSLLAIFQIGCLVGSEWTAPLPIPGFGTNTFYPTFDEAIGKIVVTWIDMTPPNNGYSSVFDGTSWGSPAQLPNMGSLTGVIPTTYDFTSGKLLATFTDTTAIGYSSLFDGSTWSAKLAIPGATPAIIPFCSYDPAIGKVVAAWSDTTPMQSYSSIFDGAAWSVAPQSVGTTNAFIVNPAYDPPIGQIVGVWVDIGTKTAHSSRFNGTTWAAAQVIGTNVTAPHAVPVTNLAGTNNQLLVVWPDDTTHQGYYSIYDGSNWSSALPIPGSTVASALFPAYDPALGKVVVLWSDFTTNQGYFSVFDGTNWTTPEAIPGVTSQNVVGVYDSASGQFMITWRDFATNQGFSAFLISPTLAPTIVFTGGGNLARVADYINSVGQSASILPILTILSQLDQASLRDALASISNARNAFMPYMAANTAIDFNEALTSHSSELRWINMNPRRMSPLTAAADPIQSSCPMEEKQNLPTQMCIQKCDNMAVWLEGIGTLTHQKAQDQNPSFNATTGGAILGADYFDDRFNLIGALAYARTHIHEAENAGNSDIDSGMAALMGCGYIDRGYIELGCSGVYNHYDSNRHIFFPGFNEHAKAHFSGWQAVPHLALGYDVELCNWILEPFASADCAFIRQGAFEEHGAAPLNAKQHSHWAELLQARGGFRAYYTGSQEWGLWTVQFLGAYQYLKSWNVGRIADASFVGQIPGFTVISLENGQNCFVPGLEFFARGNSGLFGSLNYTGQFAKQYMANSLLAKIGYFF